VKFSAGVALVVAMALVVAACGGDGAEERRRAECVAHTENAAEAAAIAEAHERGDFTRRDMRSMRRYFGSEDRVIDEQGRMVPYRELEPMTRARFDEWRGNAAWGGLVRNALQDASRKVKQSGFPDC
jgi:hypothetical protein